MAKIVGIRPVLLSAPYAESDADANLEVRLHLPGGLRTTGMVEITLDNGMAGLGEGYLAVFAPHVFTAITKLIAPLLIGRDPEGVETLFREMVTLTGYWSHQGAARHVVSAFEIALQDCRAQLMGVPLWRALGGREKRLLSAYASGGDSITPAHMRRELEQIEKLGIRTFKIRARKHLAEKVLWCQRVGARADIAIAVDMTQNLMVPSQTVDDVLVFLETIDKGGGDAPTFIEEVLGPDQIGHLPELRRRTDVPVAGGEIVTTEDDLCARVRDGYYGIVQPDATVIGGINAVRKVFAAAREAGSRVYVHCWGGAVGMLANYHVALACGGEMVEWPMPRYDLREAMFASPLKPAFGQIQMADVPGLGARLTPAIEKEFPFREEAVYRCLVDPALIPTISWVD